MESLGPGTSAKVQFLELKDHGGNTSCQSWTQLQMPLGL